MNRKKRTTLFLIVTCTSLVVLTKNFYHPEKIKKVRVTKVPKKKPTVSAGKRTPASLGPRLAPAPKAKPLKLKRPDKVFKYKGKKLIFDGPDAPSKEELDQMKVLNEVPKDWLKKFEGQVLKFQSSDTVARIEVQEKMIRVETEGLRHINRVVVRLRNGEGLTSNYSGIMDPSTGTMLKVWNRTQYEISPIRKLRLPARALK